MAESPHIHPVPIPSDIHMEDLRLRSGPPRLRQRGTKDGPVIAAALFLPAAAAPGNRLRPGLVVAHGAGSNKVRHRSFCLEACRRGFIVMALDFRGHGESGGLVDGPLEEDVWAAASLLRSHPLVDPTRVCYRGSSMGGYYGIRSAPEATFAALALLCPANEEILLAALDRQAEWTVRSRDGLEARLDESRLRRYLSCHDTLDTAPHIDSPCLLVHARGDEKVPFRHSLDLAAHMSGDTEVVLLAGGDHSTAQSSPALHRRVVEWLASRIGLPPAEPQH
jgi:dipeptidyl aminopeptidase/acylaminoacyl peptidase